MASPRNSKTSEGGITTPSVLDAATSATRSAGAKPACASKGETPRNDDVLFAQTLAKLGDAVVLPFEWRRDSRRPPDRPGWRRRAPLV